MSSTILLILLLQCCFYHYRITGLIMMSSSTTNSNDKLKTGWRVALNIGREPNTNMPASWASSGARLPIVIPCDFSPGEEFIPKEDVIRYTGPMGEIVKRIERGTWSLKDNKLAFTFEFPEEFSRRDVTIDSGAKIRCEGMLYSISDLKEMDAIFYKAREETYAAEEIVNDVTRRKNAPKKWNEETGEWEERYPEEGKLSQLFKRINLARVLQQEKFKSNSRPLPKDLSADCGPFPGITGDVYIRNDGVLKMKQGWRDVVIGTWSAEPINDKPVSYYN